MQSVGHFSRAYDSCLKTAEISRAQAAAAAGIHPSIVSRLLNGATQLLQDHVEALLRALPDRSDREHCVRAWLLDQCPAEFRADLIISFGSISEEKMRQPDELGQALARLDKAATHKPELKRLLAYLAELEGADPPDKTNRTTGGGPADSFSKSA